MKRLILAAALASVVSLSLPSLAYADGCNSTSCTSSGTNWEWRIFGWYGCYWEYTSWYNGSWYYSDCHGSNGEFYI